MASLPSGTPGSGKSTLIVELQRRGYRALDADLVPGLAAWLNSDGTVVGDGSFKPTCGLLATCVWGWSGARCGDVLDELASAGRSAPRYKPSRSVQVNEVGCLASRATRRQ